MNRIFRRSIYILVFLFAFLGLFWIYAYITVPSEIIIFDGCSSMVDFGVPFTRISTLDNENIVAASNSQVGALEEGEHKTDVSVFGVVPLKKVNVKIVKSENLIASGKLVGLKIRTGKLLVVKVDKVKTKSGELSPGEICGIEKGDYILEANGEKLTSIGQLANIIRRLKNDSIILKLERAGECITKEVILARNIENNNLQAGLWLRDGIAGLGTLTYLKLDGSSIKYGCLGHPITDVDTGALMPVSEGRVYDASVISSQKGEVGNPGEIKGIINEQENIGNIDKNIEKGIYGYINNDKAAEISGSAYLPANQYSVYEGKAILLTEVINNKVEEYDVEIESINRGALFGTKGFKVKITDARLLEKTGGIVQGMSGSPVIQNGKLVGAVTHVLVNDPTRGYGIFIENMLDAAG